MKPHRDAIVVGAGIHGLCTAFALRKRRREVLVIDRFAAGHDNGGSHGDGRITRSSYHDRRYVEMASRANNDHWPQLEAELGQQLVHKTPGLFFGPDHGPFGKFLNATLSATPEVEEIDRQQAASRFPLLRFEPDDRVLLDHSAGVLAANRTLTGLREWLGANDVAIVHDTRVRKVRSEHDAVVVETDTGEWQANHAVLATGAWLGELLPKWQRQLTPLRQQVAYANVDANASATAVGTFPVWCRIGATAREFDYGLPEFGRAGLKVAHHRTSGTADDLNARAPQFDEAELLERARRRFAAPVHGLHGVEHCLYAVAPEEHLHVAPAAHDQRILAVAACSGHGFKFGPLIGEQVADQITAK